MPEVLPVSAAPFRRPEVAAVFKYAFVLTDAITGLVLAVGSLNLALGVHSGATPWHVALGLGGLAFAAAAIVAGWAVEKDRPWQSSLRTALYSLMFAVLACGFASDIWHLRPQWTSEALLLCYPLVNLILYRLWFRHTRRSRPALEAAGSAHPKAGI